MLDWLLANGLTLAVLAVVAALVGLAVRNLLPGPGGSSCSGCRGGCSGCGGSCPHHKE